MHRPTLLVIAPIVPSATGNGLAMRVQAMVSAAAVHHDVVLVVVAVAGRVPFPSGPEPQAPRVGGPGRVIERLELAPTAPGDRRPILAWLSDPRWRPWLDELAPIPDMVAGAPPGRAPEILAAVAGREVVGVLGLRLAVAPLALAVAASLGVPLVVDADDDDVAYHRGRGREDVAQQWSRVAALCLPRSDRVLVASAQDGAAMAARWDLAERIVVVPNAVARPARAIPPPPGRHRMLVVANFTYAPNEDGARWFVHDVLPRLGPDWQLTLVGAAPPSVLALAGDRVEAAGWVADLDPWYDRADVVVVPVRSGSGTRIKVLEGFARRRPVVSTTTGIAGIAAVPGVHALVADDAGAMAAAIELLADPRRSGPLVEAAGRLVADAYDAPVVIGRTAEHLRRVTRPDRTDP